MKPFQGIFPRDKNDEIVRLLRGCNQDHHLSVASVRLMMSVVRPAITERDCQLLLDHPVGEFMTVVASTNPPVGLVRDVLTGLAVIDWSGSLWDDLWFHVNKTAEQPLSLPITFDRWLAYLIRVAKDIHLLAALTDDDLVLVGTIQASWFSMTEFGAQRANHFGALARWAQYHFPVLRLSAQQASALSLSDLTEDQLDQATAPWPSFVLDTSMAFSRSDGNAVVGTVVQQKRSRHDLVDPRRPANRLWTLASDIQEEDHDGTRLFTLWHTNQESQQLYQGPHAANSVGRISDGFVEMGKEEDRISQMLNRSCLNACVALSTGTADVAKAKRRKGKGAKSRPVAGQGLQYVLGLPVQVDMRQHLTSYLHGDRNKVFKVRWVVRGHWRNQPYGPGRSLRRMKWIEPFWKGPEAASKLVREHELKDQTLGGQK